MDARYDFIIQIIREAGKLLLIWQKEKFETTAKNADPRNLVTSVDLAVNDFLVQKINKDFPGETICSEELTGPSELPAKFWSLDPIDGTANFARGLPHFAICLTYIEKNEPLVGAVYNPITNELFSFQKGIGARLNNRPILVSRVKNISDAYVLLHIGRKKQLWNWGLNLQRFLLSAAKKNVNWGASALDLCFLAAGRVDIVIYGTLTTLDVAVALGLVRAARGEIYTLNGKPAELTAQPQTIIASSSRSLFEEIIKNSFVI